MEKEIWTPINGLEDTHLISTLGRIRSLTVDMTVIKRGKSVPYRKAEIIIKQQVNKFGYHSVQINKNYKNRYFSVHRLVALHFIPNPENKRTVNHKDGNKSNNALSNLEWATHQENARHAWDTGLKYYKMTHRLAAQKIVVNLETGIFYDSAKQAWAEYGIQGYGNFKSMLNGSKRNKTMFKYA